MAVYLIRAGETGPVKIGWAVQPLDRMAEFQTGNHEVLGLLKAWPGGRTEEAALHRRFAAYRVRAEWFVFQPEMMTVDPSALVAEAAAEVGLLVQRQPCALQYVFDQAGGVAALARAIGRHHASLIGWKRVPAEHAVSVAHATGIPLHLLRPDVFPVPVQANAA